MVALVGGLSCRPLSLDTATEFAAASGVAIGAGTGLRVVAQELVKLVPWGGSVISAGIAASGTYAIGKSAEAYFFFDRKQRPEELRVEWRPELPAPGDE
ncbi:MAG TPA: hypothetical protein VFA26_09820, partial [Gemmataceae bacterium]|nr:hypothetical protein [Gemmataceae bacterium]